jgi:hypothetical protein
LSNIKFDEINFLHKERVFIEERAGFPIRY